MQISPMSTIEQSFETFNAEKFDGNVILILVCYWLLLLDW